MITITMSGHDHSEFFGDQTIHNIGKYFGALNEEQQASLRSFHDQYCNPSFTNRYVQQSPDQLLFPLTTYGRTPHNLFIAVRTAIAAHDNPADYDIFTWRAEDHAIIQERYEVLEVRHAALPGSFIPDRILYAKEETSSKKIALELGSRISWLELELRGDKEHLLRLPAEHFTLPPFEILPPESRLETEKSDN